MFRTVPSSAIRPVHLPSVGISLASVPTLMFAFWANSSRLRSSRASALLSFFGKRRLVVRHGANQSSWQPMLPIYPAEMPESQHGTTQG